MSRNRECGGAKVNEDVARDKKKERKMKAATAHRIVKIDVYAHAHARGDKRKQAAAENMSDASPQRAREYGKECSRREEVEARLTERCGSDRWRCAGAAGYRHHIAQCACRGCLEEPRERVQQRDAMGAAPIRSEPLSFMRERQDAAPAAASQLLPAALSDSGSACRWQAGGASAAAR